MPRAWFIVLAVALASCGSCGDKKEDGGGPATVVEPLAPAPEDLLCDVVVTTPNASWHKLQIGIGGAVGILPSTLPGVMISMADLDPLLADAIDGTAPMYAVFTGSVDLPRYAVAMKILDVRKAKSFLTDGEDARFTAHEDAGITELVAKSRPEDRRTAVALTPNAYLLVGKRPEDLRKLAGYVTRTLPSRPVPTEAAVIEVPRAAIVDRLRPSLGRLWNTAKEFLLAEDDRMRTEKGRAPDFGDPKAIVESLDGIVQSKLDLLGDLGGIRVAFEVKDDRVAFTATLPPHEGKGRVAAWADSMTTGDAAPFLALPLASAMAMTTRDSEPEREAQSRELEKILVSSFSGKLSEADAKRVHEVFADAAKARGEWSAWSWVAEEPSGAFFRFAVRDEAAAARAMRGSVEMGRASPFKEILRARDLTTSTDEVASVGKVSVAMFTREAKGKEKPSPLGLAWKVDEGTLGVAAGGEPSVVFRLGAKPDKKLGDDPFVTGFVAEAGDASTFLTFQPLRVDPRRANLPVSPLVIAVGKKEKTPTVKGLVSDALLREVSRLQVGF